MKQVTRLQSKDLGKIFVFSPKLSVSSSPKDRVKCDIRGGEGGVLLPY